MMKLLLFLGLGLSFVEGSCKDSCGGLTCLQHVKTAFDCWCICKPGENNQACYEAVPPTPTEAVMTMENQGDGGTRVYFSYVDGATVSLPAETASEEAMDVNCPPGYLPVHGTDLDSQLAIAHGWKAGGMHHVMKCTKPCPTTPEATGDYSYKRSACHECPLTLEYQDSHCVTQQELLVGKLTELKKPKTCLWSGRSEEAPNGWRVFYRVGGENKKQSAVRCKAGLEQIWPQDVSSPIDWKNGGLICGKKMECVPTTSEIPCYSGSDPETNNVVFRVMKSLFTPANLKIWKVGPSKAGGPQTLIQKLSAKAKAGSVFVQVKSKTNNKVLMSLLSKATDDITSNLNPVENIQKCLGVFAHLAANGFADLAECDGPILQSDESKGLCADNSVQCLGSWTASAFQVLASNSAEGKSGGAYSSRDVTTQKWPQTTEDFHHLVPWNHKRGWIQAGSGDTPTSCQDIAKSLIPLMGGGRKSLVSCINAALSKYSQPTTGWLKAAKAVQIENNPVSHYERLQKLIAPSAKSYKTWDNCRMTKEERREARKVEKRVKKTQDEHVTKMEGIRDVAEANKALEKAKAGVIGSSEERAALKRAAARVKPEAQLGGTCGIEYEKPCQDKKSTCMRKDGVNKGEPFCCFAAGHKLGCKQSQVQCMKFPAFARCCNGDRNLDPAYTCP